ncbi:MAG: T9SS type A sorting domain-containing protein [Chitinophagaceae bacterium]
MKILSTLLFFSCFTFFAVGKAFSQVNLPYTLSFTSNDAANWADGIANDGDGGTSDINGLDIEIFAANSGFTLLSGATMTWHDNNYFASNESGYTGITPGPDVPMTNNGVPAMVIRSANPANNFSLVSLRLYDWGDVTTLNIEAFNNGVSLGTVQVHLNASDWDPETISQSDILTSTIFQSVDEVRFYPDSAPVTWLSMNDISLAAPSSTLPVQWISFNATLTNETTALLTWQTTAEENNRGFVVEHSSDGSQFSEKGSQSATDHSSNLNNYQFLVAGLTAGQHYFRIRQVDADGRFSYSRIITLTVGQLSRISVYPNPVRSTTTISAGGSIVQQLFVYSVGGKLMERQEPGAAQVVLNMGRYPQGIYFIELITADGKHRQRVVKE